MRSKANAGRLQIAGERRSGSEVVVPYSSIASFLHPQASKVIKVMYPAFFDILATGLC